MRSLTLLLIRILAALTGTRSRRYVRAIVSLLVALSLLGQGGYGRSPVAPRPGPASSLTNTVDAFNYASSFFTMYPGIALAQGGVITKTGPSKTNPGNSISYPIFVEKTSPSDWLTGTVLITDAVPANTGSPSGAPETGWSYTFTGDAGRFKNEILIAGTGLITVGNFNVVVNSPLVNGTVITNTAYLSTSTGTEVSPAVTTTVEASDFSVTKYPSSSPVCAGSLLTYTVTVSNINPDPFNLIVVPYTETDRLPSQVSLVYASDSPATSGDMITWTVSNTLESLWGAGANVVTRTAVVSVPYSLNNGITLSNYITVSHRTVVTTSYLLPVTVTKVSADFTSNSPVAYGAAAIFTNTTTGDAAFGWGFGDGGTSTAANPTHVYGSEGVFTVTLAATSTHGCGTLSATHPITVLMPATVTVTANPTNTAANGISSTLVTAALSDTFGSPIGGAPLTFTTSLGNWAGDGQTVVLTTIASGIATATLTSTLAGVAYITVTAPNGISGTAQVIFGRVLNLNTGIWYITIQGANDAAANGHALLATAGTYSENVVIDKQITLTGVSSDTVTVVPADPVGEWRHVRVVTDNVTIRNMTFDGDATGSGTTNPIDEGIWVNEANNFTISDCRVREYGVDGIYVTVNDGGTPDDLTTGGHLIQGNEVYSITVGGSAANVNGGILLENATGQVRDNVVRDSNVGYAIYYANTSSTTDLPRPTISGNRLSNLRGVTAGASFVNNRAILFGDPALVLTNTISNCEYGIQYQEQLAGSPERFGDSQIYGNSIIYSTVPLSQVAGIYVLDVGSQPTRTVEVRNNRVENTSGSPIAGTGVAIDNVSSGALLVGDNVLADMRLGVQVWKTGMTPEVVSNTITLAAGANSGAETERGIWLTTNHPTYGPGDALARIAGNRITGYDIGIHADDSAANPNFAFATVGGAAAAEGNAITGNATGIRVNGSDSRAVAQNNTIAANSADGIEVSGSGVITAHANVICSNASYGLNNLTASTIDAIGNWWGRNDPITNTLPPADITGTVSYVPPISFTLTAAPSVIVADGASTSAITVAMSGGGYALPGPITANINTDYGTLWPGQVILTNGAANSALTLTSTTSLVTATLVATTTGLPCNGVTTTTVRFDLPSLDLSKGDSPDPVQAGATLTYTLTYTNYGGVQVNNAWLTDTLPLSVTLNSSAPPTATQSGNLVGWSLGSLPPYSSSQIIMAVTVGSPIISGTVLTNTAFITAPGAPLGATALATTTVWSRHALTVTKSAAPDPVGAGATLAYTIAYTVTGNEPAVSTIVTDAVPANTAFNSASLGVTPVNGVLTWTLGTLYPPGGGVLTFTVQVVSPLPNGTVLTNSVYSFDALGQVASATVTTTVASSHTLHLAKSDAPDPVDAGAKLTYTLAYSVTGGEQAQGATISDALPANTAYASCGGAPCVGAGGLVTWSVGTLNPGASGLLTMVVTVTTPLPDGTVLTNTAHFYDSNGGTPVSATVTTTVASSCTLAIAKSDAPDPVQAGNILNYTIVYTVSGSQVAPGAVVTDPLPANAFFHSSSPGGVLIGNAVQWSLGDLMPPIAGVLTYSVQVASPLPNGTVLSNTAYFLAAGVSAVSDTVTTTVSSDHALFLMKDGQPDPVQAGEIITYTLTYIVTGNEPAPGATISDAVPANTAYVGCGGAPCGVAGGVVSWTLGTLNPAAVGSVTYTVRVTSPLADGTLIANTAYFFDGDGERASDSEFVTVQSSHELHLVKSDAPDPVVTGAALTYTLAYSVTGGEQAPGATISDAVPANTTYASCGGAPCVEAGGLVTWSVGTLNPGASGLLTMVVTVTAPLPNGTVLTNRAYFYDTDASTPAVSSTATTTVSSSHTLVVVKGDAPDPVQAGNPLLYLITYTVSGSEPAPNAAISDAVPANTTYGGCGGAPCGVVGGVVTWTLGVLNPPVTGTVVMTVNVNGGLPGGTVLSNTAHFFDAGGGAVSDTVTTTVRGDHALTILKNGDPDPVQAGEIITYSLTYIVTGNEPAPGATISDVVPANTAFLWASGGVTPVNGVLTWTLGTLSPVAVGSISYTVRVTSPLPNFTFITNTARFFDSDEGYDEGSETVVVLSSHTLAVAKGDVPDPVQVGTPLVYLITYAVSGSEPAPNAAITDAVPANTAYGGCGGAPCSQVGGVVTWTLGVLNPPVTGTVIMTVNVTGGTVLTNTARLFDDGGLAASDVETTTVQQPSLAVGKTAVPPHGSTVAPGGTIAYTVLVTNSGSVTVSNVTISDSIPANTAYAGGLSYSPGATGSAPPVRVLTATLLPGRTLTATFLVTVNGGTVSGTIISNLAAVTATGGLLVDSNVVSHTVITQPVGLPVLEINKRAAPPHGSTVTPGQSITYTVTVTNTGTATATNVILSDSVPANTAYVPGSASGSGTVYQTNPLTMTVASLAVGNVTTMTFRVTVSLTATNGATISNSATVDSDQTAPQASNTVTHLVSSVLGLSIAKSAVPASGSNVMPGDSIRYNITVVNTGTALASNVTISDSIPANTAYAGGLSYSPGATGSAPPVRVVTATLLPGGTLTATFLVTVNGGTVSGTIISNLAAVTATGGLPVNSNVVTHRVITQPVGAGPVYLPIILKENPPPVPTPTPTTEICYPQLVTVVPVGVSPRGVAVDSANNRIYVANYASGSVSVINGATNAVIQTVSGVPGANGIAYDGTNRRLYVTNRDSSSLTIIETVGHTLVGAVAVGSLPNGVAYNSVTNKIYVANYGSNTVTIFNAASPATPLATLGGFSEPSHIAVDTTTGKVYVTNHGGASVTVINGVTNSIITTISLYDSTAPYGIAIDTVRHYAYVVTIDTYRIVTINTASDTLLNPWTAIKRLDATPVPLRVLAVDGTLGTGHLYITTASSDGGFDKLLTIAKGFDEGFNRPFAFDTGANPVEGVALNPANHRVYVTARDANQVTVVQDGVPPCMWNFEQDFVLEQGYFPE